MKVSIVTATFNRSPQMEYGLSTILKQTDLPEELEIIVVDDGSVDNTKEVFDKLKATASWKGIEMKYIYLPHPEHRISSIPRNVGIKQATGEIIIFTESEILHVGNTISQLLKKLEENPIRTPVATCVYTMGERIWKDLNSLYFEDPQRIIEHQYAMIVSGNMQNTKAPDSDWGITGSHDCLTGCLFAVRKDDLLAVGGFDESFEGHGFDDFDLFNRLAPFGKGVLPCNDIVIIHQWHKKEYPYNIYEASDKNGAKSAQRIAQGEIKVNVGREWGVID